MYDSFGLDDRESVCDRDRAVCVAGFIAAVVEALGEGGAPLDLPALLDAALPLAACTGTVAEVRQLLAHRDAASGQGRSVRAIRRALRLAPCHAEAPVVVALLLQAGSGQLDGDTLDQALYNAAEWAEDATAARVVELLMDAGATVGTLVEGNGGVGYRTVPTAVLVALSLRLREAEEGGDEICGEALSRAAEDGDAAGTRQLLRSLGGWVRENGARLGSALQAAAKMPRPWSRGGRREVLLLLLGAVAEATGRRCSTTPSAPLRSYALGGAARRRGGAAAAGRGGGAAAAGLGWGGGAGGGRPGAGGGG